MRFAQAYVEIRANMAQLSANMKQAEGVVQSSFSRVIGFAKSAGAAIAGYLGARALFRFAKEAVSAAAEHEEIMTLLENTITATGQAAGFTAQELASMAISLQLVTKYSDETILRAMAMLATFKNIKGANFTAALKTVLDISALRGRAPQDMAIALGKALSDPIDKLSGLARVGITFSESQEKAIHKMAKLGDLARAQRAMLDALAQSYGGAALAAGQTLAGQLAITENAFGEFREQLGAGLADGMGLQDVLAELTQGLADGGTEATEMGETISSVLSTILMGFRAIYFVGKSLLGGFLIVIHGISGSLQALGALILLIVEKTATATEKLTGIGGGVAKWAGEQREELATGARIQVEAIADIGEEVEKDYARLMEVATTQAYRGTKMRVAKVPGKTAPPSPEEVMARKQEITLGTIAGAALAGAGGPGTFGGGIARAGFGLATGPGIQANPPTRELQERQLMTLEQIAANTRKEGVATLG